MSEVNFVNWMRDRFDSDVQILAAALTNGGGIEYTITFIGRGRFEGMADTLVLNTLPNDADDRIRRELVRVFTLGLARYVARSPIASRMNLSYAAPFGGRQQVAAGDLKDKWNLWTYTTNFNAFVRAEERQQQVNGSLSQHWSAGMKLGAGFSDFLNQDLALRAQPAVEYNIFPWTEQTRRQLTILYNVGPNLYDYQRTTVYGKDREARFSQQLTASFVARQAWGSTNGSLDWLNYLHDFERNALTLSGNADLRPGRGFSLDIRGSAARVNDQIHLPAAGNTEEEILLQPQALHTVYRVSMNVGIWIIEDAAVLPACPPQPLRSTPAPACAAAPAPAPRWSVAPRRRSWERSR